MSIRTLSVEGVEKLQGQVFTDLFGEKVTVVDSSEVESAIINVSTKLTPSENAAVERYAAQFHISKYKFLRDCIKQQLKDLDTLFEY